MLFIGLNMLAMTLDHYHQNEMWSFALDNLNMGFIVVFSSECILKIFALRLYYFKEPWNMFDFVVVVLSILGKYCLTFIGIIKKSLGDYLYCTFIGSISLTQSYTFSRYCSEWLDWSLFCISNIAPSRSGGENWKSSATCQGSKRHSNVVVCIGNVDASPVQYLSPTFPRDVYICHIWNVFLYERQTSRNSW